MKRPAFQFYPADWTNNAKLRRCSYRERGVWLAILCLMHDSDEYGVLRWPLREIIDAVGCKPADVDALVARAVMKGVESGTFDGYSFRPMHGRKLGAPVLLIAPCIGPIYFSSRMVEDEYKRVTRANHGGNGEDREQQKDAPKAAPMPPFGDPPSSSSTPTVETPPHSPPRGASSSRKGRRRDSTTFDEFVAECQAKGEPRIPEDDPVHRFAQAAGIPERFVGLAWKRFRARHEGKTKRYKHWRQVFRNAVEDNWYALWYFDKEDGGCRLTTAGEAFRRTLTEEAHA